MRQKIVKTLTSWPIKLILSLAVIYLLIGYFAVGPLAKRMIPWIAEQKFSSHASVERVDFDPLRLQTTIENLRLTERSGAPLAGFKRLFVDFEISGLFQFTWRLKDIRLSEPGATFDIAPDGRLNWADLIAKLNEDKTPSNTIPRVLIDHILIEHGNIQYVARNRPVPFKAALEPLELELGGLSTLPDESGKYSIEAKLPEQGGTLRWKGDMALNPVASSGTIMLEGVKLAKLASAANHLAMPMTLQNGEIKASLVYGFSLVKDKPLIALTDIAVTLANFSGKLASEAEVQFKELDLKLPRLDIAMQADTQVRFHGMQLGLHALKLASFDNRPLFDLEQAKVNQVDFDLKEHSLNIAHLALMGGSVNATRLQDGSIDWLKVLATATTRNAKPADSAENLQPVQPQSAQQIAADKARAAKEQPWKFHMAQAQLQDWRADYKDQGFKYPLSISLTGLNLDFALSGSGGSMAIKSLKSEAGPVIVKSALSSEPQATLDKLRLDGGDILVQDKQIKLQSIIASGLHAKVLQEPGKPLNWIAMLEPLKAVAATTTAAEPEKSSWTLTLQKFALENASARYEDRSLAMPLVLDIENASLEANNPSLDLMQMFPVKAAFEVKQGGKFDASGQMAISPLHGYLNLNLADLALKPFSPFINQAARLKINNGVAVAKGKLTFKSEQALSATFTGGFSVNKLAINEEQSNQSFLSWKSVSSKSMEAGIAPNYLNIAELRVVEPAGEVIIHEDRTMNVTRILRNPSNAAKPIEAAHKSPKVAAASAQQAVPAESKPNTFPITIKRTRIDNAELEFADLSLTPQFGTHINKLSGVINKLSTNPDTAAQVQLAGRVDEYGTARIEGSIQPFHVTNFTDLNLIFRNLEMSRLTPYSGKFAGRRIDSGKLSVDLEYKIKNRQLAGENKFVINKIRLGEKVVSPGAADLPLDLAIALLEDNEGVINLDLPISGSLDDPQFSYAAVVWKAFRNVLAKVITSPFRALGKLLGTDSAALETVAFAAGIADIAPPEQEKLNTVGQALSKRPTLTLTIEPAYNSTLDSRAIQQNSIGKQVAQALGIKLEPGEQPDPIDLSDPKTQDAIETLADKSFNRSRIQKIKDALTKSDEEKRLQREQLLEKLIVNVQVSETDLQNLAKARAEAIQKLLVQSEVAAEKIGIGPTVKHDGKDDTVQLQLKLGTNLNVIAAE